MNFGKADKGYLLGVTVGFLFAMVARYHSPYIALFINVSLACSAAWIIKKIEESEV